MSSIVSVSPSFSSHSFNNLVDIADRVVQELRNENCFNDDDDDDIFNFSSDDNRPEKEEKNDPREDEQEFEFPVVCGESNSSPISADHHEVLSENTQILPRYPLFDRSLLLDVDPDFSNAVDCSEIEECTPSPVARLSLRKLFSEERDSASSSSSEADDLDRITPGSYCVWKPKTESRGHKKSYSIGNNISKRWKVRDLLKRSYSDDNYSTGKDTPAVVLFTPPIATKQQNTSSNEKVKKIEKTAKVASAVGDSSASIKTENNIPVHKAKAGGHHRLPPYLPYRQDQVGLFAHFNGSSKNLYRY